MIESFHCVIRILYIKSVSRCLVEINLQFYNRKVNLPQPDK
jgi:hypothetical protein